MTVATENIVTKETPQVDFRSSDLLTGRDKGAANNPSIVIDDNSNNILAELIKENRGGTVI